MKKKTIILMILIFIINIISVSSTDLELTNGAVIFYSLDDADLNASNDPIDLTDLLDNGSRKGATTGVAGKTNEGFDFDGVDDNITVQSFTKISALPFTICGFMESDTGGGSNSNSLAGLSYFDEIDGFYAIGQISGAWTMSTRLVGQGAVHDSFGTSNTSLVHVCGVWASSNLRKLYVDGVNVANFTDVLLFISEVDTFQVGDLRTSSSPTTPMDGMIDAVGLWNRSLNTSEILALATGLQYDFTVNNLPNVTLILPTNGDNLNDNPVELIFNVTDADNDTVNCTVFVNGTNKTTITNINTSSNPQNSYNLTETDGLFNWFVSCNDSVDISNSSTYNFTIDRTSPNWIIRTILTNNNTKFDRTETPFIFWNDTINDTNLFAYNVTVKFPNNTIWFSNQTIDFNQSLFNYSWNSTINLSFPNGTYIVNYYAEDDHTANLIDDYNYNIITDGLLYNFDEYYIKVGVENQADINVISTTKLKDRYTFEFEYKNSKNTRVYILESDNNIYYREKHDFPVFVIGKNWVDFNINISNVDYSVNKINNNKYSIEIIKEVGSNLDIIRSLGGLNIVNETYSFLISANQKPNITNTTPIQNFTIDDGSQVNFTTIAIDFDNDTLTYEYFFNGVSVNNSANWTWTVPFNSHGINNMTVIVSDTVNDTDNFTWTINITDKNIEAIVNNVSRTPITTWYANTENTYFTCNGTDGDNETPPANWTVEIDYRTNIIWNSLIPIFDSGNVWKAPINLTNLGGNSIDVRCRIKDEVNFSNYVQVNNLVSVQGAYFSVGNISLVSPSNTIKDLVISVTCSPENFGSIKSYFIRYDIDAWYNNTWHNLSYNFFDKTLFDMSLIDYGDNVTFRCRANDTITTTNFLVGQNVTRKHITNLIMFDRGNDEVETSHKPYFKGLYADFFNEIGVSIVSSFADCNGDGFFDYYNEYNDSRNTTTENFLCYNSKGIIPHTVGVFINKTNSSNSLCGFGKTGLCRIQRDYGVLVK